MAVSESDWNTSYDVLCQLLVSTIDESATIGAFSKVNWLEVKDLAAAQGVLAFAWEGVLELLQRGEVSVDAIGEDLYYAWLGQVMLIEKGYEKLCGIATKMDGIASSSGVRILMFKGLDLSRLYPCPNHREFGDIDFFVLDGLSSRMEACLVSAGARIRTVGEKHSVLDFEDVVLENHFCFVWPFASRKLKRLEAFLKGTLPSASVLPGYSNVLSPSIGFDVAFVLAHAAGHLRTEGISLRHLLDWIVVEKRAISASVMQELWDGIVQFGLDEFARILNCLGNEMLHADVPQQWCQCNPQLKERVKRDILYGSTEVCLSKSWLGVLWWKVSRFWHRMWTLPLVGMSMGCALLRVVVSHLCMMKRSLSLKT